MRTGFLLFAFIHPFMSYEDNLKRTSTKFAVHSPVQYDWICIDGQKVGHPMMCVEAHTIRCWLAHALDDMKEVLREPELPSWLTGKEPEKPRKRKSRRK